MYSDWYYRQNNLIYRSLANWRNWQAYKISPKFANWSLIVIVYASKLVICNFYTVISNKENSIRFNFQKKLFLEDSSHNICQGQACESWASQGGEVNLSGTLDVIFCAFLFHTWLLFVSLKNCSLQYDLNCVVWHNDWDKVLGEPSKRRSLEAIVSLRYFMYRRATTAQSDFWGKKLPAAGSILRPYSSTFSTSQLDLHENQTTNIYHIWKWILVSSPGP